MSRVGKEYPDGAKISVRTTKPFEDMTPEEQKALSETMDIIHKAFQEENKKPEKKNGE